MRTAPRDRSFAWLTVAAAVLMLVLAGHAGVFAGALTSGFLAHGHGHGDDADAGHGHTLSLRGDAAHVDVVFHHDERESPADDAGPGYGAHDGDHVVHFAPADTAREGNRRISAPTTALSVATSIAPVRLGSPVRGPSAAAPAAAAAVLRTVVLRI